MLQIFSFSLFRQYQCLRRRLLLFLDEPVQEHDFFLHHRKERPPDASWQPRTNFPDALTQIVHQWLANRPCVLDGQNIRTNRFAFLFGQAFKSFTDRLVARAGLVKNHVERAFAVHRPSNVSKMIHLSSA